ncbi:uncharacterized protein LOC126249796 [Schistocerca nitens]|uniref:uncharacterized protein LOC126249796 n=1 Tax=Schistocerca nitens TaxID=7011 RepID=UPI002118E3E2|nr:uncharacterized protein LOC126249796 [Schistocerca nitens]
MELNQILVLAITIAGVVSVPDNRRLVAVDKETYIYQGHKYAFHRERVTWEEAAQICSDEGGYLAVLEDMAETEFIAEAMAGGLCFFHPYQNIWIGGRYVDGNWMWVPTGIEIPSKIGSDGYPPWAINVRRANLCLTMNRLFITRPVLSDLNCDRKRNFVCEHGCAQLKNNERQTWDPPLCSETFSELGDECSLVCKNGYELAGSATVTCTADGWNGTGGLNKIPVCKTPEEVGEDFVNKINSTLNGIAANMLFLLDESVSLTPQQFEMEKYFVKSVAQAFPLSINRTAGLITFSHVADIDIPLTQTDTCEFVDSVGELVYTKGGTSILVALNLAVDEVKKNAIHDTTLVFLITDGISTTDPTPAADTLKANGDIVFTIGIADYQRDQLEPLSTVSSDGTPNFFGVSSFEVFLKIAQYLNTTYIDQSQINCN